MWCGIFLSADATVQGIMAILLRGDEMPNPFLSHVMFGWSHKRISALETGMAGYGAKADVGPASLDVR